MSARARTTATKDSKKAPAIAVDKAFEMLSRESEVLDVLVGRIDEIRRLRSRISDQRIAEFLAQALDTSPESIRYFIEQHIVRDSTGAPLPSYQIDQNDTSYSLGNATASAPARPARRVRVPASEIRSAITTVMKTNKIRVLRITDEKTVNQILDMVPSLKELPKHERNRRIIDSCANRKHGPVMRSTGGAREIVIAA